MCAVPRGFVRCKVAFIFVVCLTDLFMDLESFFVVVLHFVLFVKTLWLCGENGI